MANGDGEGAVSVMIGGEAGYGIMTSGEILARSFSRGGLHVHTDVEYPSLIRGGHNTYQVIASAREVHGILNRVDVLIALDDRTVREHTKEVGPGGKVLFDMYEKPVDPKKEYPKLRGEIVPIPLTDIVKERKGDKVMRNTVALRLPDYYLYLQGGRYRPRGEDGARGEVVRVQVDREPGREGGEAGQDPLL